MSSGPRFVGPSADHRLATEPYARTGMGAGETGSCTEGRALRRAVAPPWSPPGGQWNGTEFRAKPPKSDQTWV